MGLEGIRETAKRNQKCWFTALLHHVTPSLLMESFYALRKQAAANVGGVTWQEYESLLYGRVHECTGRYIGAYRAQPSQRMFILKADGRLRPNPPKLRDFSNFFDSWPYVVFGLGFLVLRGFPDVGRSVLQSSRAVPGVAC